MKNTSTFKLTMKTFIILMVMIILTGATVMAKGFRHDIKEAWQKKGHLDKSKLEDMYPILTDASEFEELDSLLDKGLRESFEFIYEISDYRTTTEISDYDKIVVITDWISNNVEYDLTNTHKHYYDVLKYNKGDCVGYAMLLNKCLSLLGYESDIISLHANVEDKYFDKKFYTDIVEALSVGHAINMVEIDGKNYLIDAGWYDVLRDKDFILFGQDVFNKEYLNNDINTGFASGMKMLEEKLNNIEITSYVD